MFFFLRNQLLSAEQHRVQPLTQCCGFGKATNVEAVSAGGIRNHKTYVNMLCLLTISGRRREMMFLRTHKTKLYKEITAFNFKLLCVIIRKCLCSELVVYVYWNHTVAR